MGYLIVTLDGGGIRGLYTARLLERLQAEVPFLDKVDFFAGTSIGAINAAYLAKHRSVEGLADVFLSNGRKIFRSRDLMDRLVPGDEIIRANYDQSGLRVVLEGLFGKDTLADFPAKCMITTFDLDNEAQPPAMRIWKPKYGHSWDEADAKIPVVDWLLRSSAAPTYFPSYQGFIDGGVVDNSPCASAMAKAVKEGYGAGREDLLRDLMTALAMIKDPPAEVTASLQALATSRQKQISLLSLGTGLNLNRISGTSHDWGIMQWMQDSRLIDMLFDGMLGPPEYVCSQVLGEHFHRLAPALTFPIDLDEVDRMDDLLAMAEAVDITETVAWLKHELKMVPVALMAGLPKLLKKLSLDGQHIGWLFWCEGCKYAHWFRTAAQADMPKASIWTFDGNMERPTFNPSLLINGSGGGGKRCHLHLHDGKVRYCSDCDHPLAGHVTDLKDWPFSGETEG